MGEVAVCLTVEYVVFHSQRVEELWQDYASHAVDGVGAHFEVSVAYGLGVNQLQREHVVYVFLVEGVVLAVVSEVIDVCILEIFLLGNLQHFVAVGLGEKFALCVEKFQCVPLSWVMACGDDDATVGL